MTVSNYNINWLQFTTITIREMLHAIKYRRTEQYIVNIAAVESIFNSILHASSHQQALSWCVFLWQWKVGTGLM